MTLICWRKSWRERQHARSVQGVALFQKCFTTLYFSNFHLSALPSTSPFILHLAPAADIIGIKLVCGAALPRSFSHHRVSKHLVSKTHNIKFDVKL